VSTGADKSRAEVDETDDAASSIPAEEEALLDRVQASLNERTRPQAVAPGGTASPARTTIVPGRRRYTDEMVALRDEIGEARLEDVPQLVAEMERMQGIALTGADLQTILIDPASPYFGHLRLREQVQTRDGTRTLERDVFIGRATYVDPKTRINVVDWRHAPVSQLYYRYSEGSDYEETFGGRDVEGEILVRRTLSIEDGSLNRIACPQGVWSKHDAPASGDGQPGWLRTDVPFRELSGGEQSATRPGRGLRPRGVLGDAPEGRQRLDRHLPEITALIDPRQFEIVTAPQAGVVVIQGGAGSGKTTIGLHRLAYLSFGAPDRFPPGRMLVITYGLALAAYIDQVLPALGVRGVRALAFQTWAEKELRSAVPWLKATVIDEAPPAVTRVKSHPALLHELERRAAAHAGKRHSRAVVELWADLLTDKARLMELLRDTSDRPVSEGDIIDAHRIMVDRVAAIVRSDPRDRPPEKKAERASAARRRSAARREAAEEAREEAVIAGTPGTSVGFGDKPRARSVDADLPEGIRRTADEGNDDEDVRGDTGIDGLSTEDDLPILDLDDVAILLRAHQLLRGVKEPFAHLFIDEAQDLSPMKLSVLIGRTTGSTGIPAGADAESRPAPRTTRPPSITLAGDTSQKLFLDNGFGDWRGVLGHLSLSHVAVDPLRIGYRSTREILALARHVMGPLADEIPPEARRSGAPVEAFRFPAAGAAVAFLAEALRDLATREPRATIALLARYPEQADRAYDGLRHADVPSLRRVRAQEFSFRPGVEVTDVRQVKGLEFDYVIMLDVNASSYGVDDESRHLLHIGVTRAAHQLWMLVTGTPSPLIPADLLRD
jgi:DNA helicase-2/ATP-dependent DNA helicase PcrA